jgi:hypothetical protein
VKIYNVIYNTRHGSEVRAFRSRTKARQFARTKKSARVHIDTIPDRRRHRADENPSHTMTWVVLGGLGLAGIIGVYYLTRPKAPAGQAPALSPSTTDRAASLQATRATTTP